MSTRLFKRLGEWTLLPDDALAAQLSHATGIRSLFRNLEERLIVLQRGTLDPSGASTLAAVRQQPVLIIG